MPTSKPKSLMPPSTISKTMTTPTARYGTVLRSKRQLFFYESLGNPTMS